MTDFPSFRGTRQRQLKFTASEVAAITHAERDSGQSPHRLAPGAHIAPALNDLGATLAGFAIHGVGDILEQLDGAFRMFCIVMVAIGLPALALAVYIGFTSTPAAEPASPMAETQGYTFVADKGPSRVPIYDKADSSTFLGSTATVSGYWAKDTHLACGSDDDFTWKLISKTPDPPPSPVFICSSKQGVMAPEPLRPHEQAATEQRPAPEVNTQPPQQQVGSPICAVPVTAEGEGEKSVKTAPSNGAADAANDVSSDPDPRNREIAQAPRGFDHGDLEIARQFLARPPWKEILAEEDAPVFVAPISDSRIAYLIQTGDVYFATDTGRSCSDSIGFTWKKVQVPLPHYAYYHNSRPGYVCTRRGYHFMSSLSTRKHTGLARHGGLRFEESQVQRPA